MNPFGMDVGKIADIVDDRVPDVDTVFSNFRKTAEDDRRSRREWRDCARGGFVLEVRRSRSVRDKA